MKTIWKFDLVGPGFWEIGKIQEVHIPKFAKIIHSGINMGSICIWALVDTEQESEVRRFVIHGTGHEISYANELIHLATIQQDFLPHRSLVWHIFEVNLPSTPHTIPLTVA